MRSSSPVRIYLITLVFAGVAGLVIVYVSSLSPIGGLRLNVPGFSSLVPTRRVITATPIPARSSPTVSWTPVVLAASETLGAGPDELTPTETVVSTLTPAPTNTRRPTATLRRVTRTATPTPSATLTRTATSTGTATPTRSATPSPSPAPTDTPSGPDITLGIVATQNGLGLNVRVVPGGFVLGSLLPGTEVQVLDGRQTFEGGLWVEILTESGLQGWVLGEYIRVTYGTPFFTPTATPMSTPSP